MAATTQKILKPTKYRAVDTSTSEQLISEDLITNGTFASDLTGWTTSASEGSAAPTQGSGVMTMNSNGSDFSRADQSFSTVVGYRYKLSIDKVTTTVTNQVKVGTSQGASDNLSEDVAAIQTYTFYFIATATTSWLRIEDGGGGAGGSYDNISVHRVESFGNNNHGQIYSGRALEFDGISDYLTTTYGSGLNPYTTPMTVACWIKRSGTEDTWFGPSNGTNQRFYMGIHSSKFDMGIQDSAWNDGTDSGTLPNAEEDTWYRVVVVAKDGVATMYINGESQFTKNYTSYTFDTNFYIGFHGGSASMVWNGSLSDFQFWEAAWTQSDITYDYLNPESLALNNGGTSLTESNLKLWYPMQDGHRGQQSYVLDGANTGLSDDIANDGGFDTDVANGAAGTYWNCSSGTWSISDGVAKHETASDTNQLRTGSGNVLTVGVSYKIEFDIVSITGGSITLDTDGASTPARSTVGTHTEYLTATNTFLDFTPDSSFAGTIDNVKIYPVNDKHHATTVFEGDEQAVNGDMETFPTLHASNDDTFTDETVDSGQNVTMVTFTLSRYEGSKAAKCTINSGGEGFVTYNKTDYVIGRTYLAEVYMKRGNSGQNITAFQMFADDSIRGEDGTDGAAITPSLSFARAHVEFVATATTMMINMKFTGDNSDFAIIDAFSIKEVGTASGWTDADQQLDIPQTALQSYNQLAWFDGKNDIVTANANYTPTNLTTVSFWVFLNGADGEARGLIDNIEWEQSGFRIIATAANKLNLQTASSSDTNSYLSTATTITRGRWIHCAATLNYLGGATDGHFLYIDGEDAGSDKSNDNDANNMAQAADVFNIGYGGGLTQTYLNGCITEISVWNAMLSATEITELYNDGKALDARNHSKASSNLVHYWQNNGLAQWDDLKGSNYGAVTCSDTLLIPAGVDASRDNQGFIMNRQKDTNALNLTCATEPVNDVDDTNYVKLNDSIISDFANTCSFSFWVKKNDDYGSFHSIVNLWKSVNEYIAIGTEQGTEINISFQPASGYYDFRINTGTGHLTTDEWKHVTVCFASGTHTTANSGQDGSASNPLIDSAGGYDDDELIDAIIQNCTDSSSGTQHTAKITDNTATNIIHSSALSSSGDWAQNDKYAIIKVYVNGAADDSITAEDTGNPNASDVYPDYKIGGDEGSSRQFKGMIDDVLVYDNKWLTQAEVTRIYKAGKRSHR